MVELKYNKDLYRFVWEGDLKHVEHMHGLEEQLMEHLLKHLPKLFTIDSMDNILNDLRGWMETWVSEESNYTPTVGDLEHLIDYFTQLHVELFFGFEGGGEVRTKVMKKFGVTNKEYWTRKCERLLYSGLDRICNENFHGPHRNLSQREKELGLWVVNRFLEKGFPGPRGILSRPQFWGNEEKRRLDRYMRILYKLFRS